MASREQPTKNKRFGNHGGFDQDDISAFEKSHHHSQGDTSELGQAADAPSGSGPKSAKK
jgi:hypothetical protein